jgi:hypothetical protein
LSIYKRFFLAVKKIIPVAALIAFAKILNRRRQPLLRRIIECCIYFITVTIPFLKRIKEYVKTVDVYSISESEKIFRDRLFKCIIFYVFFHEYAHIYNGDCDDANLLPQKEREDKADKFAEEMYLKVKILQYRFGEDSPSREVNNLMKNLAMDDVAFSMARNFLMVLRKEVQ